MATDYLPHAAFESYDNVQPVVSRLDQTSASTDGGGVSRFWDNRFRIRLPEAASMPVQDVRARGTTCRTVQVSTLRRRLPKLAV